MKKILATVALVPFLALSGAAVAGDFPEQGKIREMNSWSFTLENGMMFQVFNPAEIKDLQPGQEVRVTYIDHPEDGNLTLKIERPSSPQN